MSPRASRVAVAVMLYACPYSSKCSSQVSRAYSTGSCGQYPTRPARVTVPSSAARAPTMTFISVDLPEPFSPTNPTTSPGYSARSTPRSTGRLRRTGHTPRRYPFSIPSAVSTGAAATRSAATVGAATVAVAFMAASVHSSHLQADTPYRYRVRDGWPGDQGSLVLTPCATHRRRQGRPERHGYGEAARGWFDGSLFTPGTATPGASTSCRTTHRQSWLRPAGGTASMYTPPSMSTICLPMAGSRRYRSAM